ncbi:hypothetical protein MNBD_GAMMA10-1407 [hydrothermal vent metagenome]|uniref:Uncharacterized protein n=1 Tax=hydrothermal vent metagenome TaxID=652676 RepID=A0A3B0XM55_9ZZZZ
MPEVASIRSNDVIPEKPRSKKPGAEKHGAEKHGAEKRGQDKPRPKTEQKEKKSTDKSVIEARRALHAIENYSFRTPLLVLTIVLLILWGFIARPEEYLTAEDGLGYALGIIGGTMMLLLLLYPVRKKIMVGKYLGTVPGWFKFHMFCGVFGPIAVLYHSNFSLGSLNSTVALMCMIVVATSGLFGRYFYSKIHYGLYGRKASLDELRGIIESEEHQLAAAYKLIPDIAETLKDFHRQASMQVSVGESFKRFFSLGFKLRVASLTLPGELRVALRAHGQKAGWSEKQTNKNYRILKKHIRSLLHSVIKTCEFSVYERLFSLWHLFHFPLFIMLVISGIVHVLAVHMY